MLVLGATYLLTCDPARYSYPDTALSRVQIVTTGHTKGAGNTEHIDTLWPGLKSETLSTLHLLPDFLV